MPAPRSERATLALLGQARHAPHDGSVLVLVLGLARRHFDQRLLQRVHGAQEPLDALDLAGAPASDHPRIISGITHIKYSSYLLVFSVFSV